MKKSLLLFAVLLWAAVVHAEVVHHEQSDPTASERGFTQECWENTENGKIYADAQCTQELNAAEVVTYAKLTQDPVSVVNGFTTCDTITYAGNLFNWAAETVYANYRDTGVRHAEFVVLGTDVANARLKWFKDCGYVNYGNFTISVYVNNSLVYSINQDGDKFLEGLFSVPLPGLKTNDVVKFEVNRPDEAQWVGSPKIAACLEYTRSGAAGIPITITADSKQKFAGVVDPQLTWTVTKGALIEGTQLSDITISRQQGEEPGTYTITVSQPEGANPEYFITFVDGSLTVVSGVHHSIDMATASTIGYTQSCWENPATGKWYADDYLNEEINPVAVKNYARLFNAPFGVSNGFTTKEENETYSDNNFKWPAETTFAAGASESTRSIEFVVFGTDVDNARIKWYHGVTFPEYGMFTIKAYVNGKQVYTVNTHDTKNVLLPSLNEIPLTGLKNGDAVKFEVFGPQNASWKDKSICIAACLEYTRSGETSVVPLTLKPVDVQKFTGANDPKLTWTAVKGGVLANYPLNNISISRQAGEEPGTYTISMSQPQGANPKYNITFETGTFTVVSGKYHAKADPTQLTIGYTQNCWEDLNTNKLYADAYGKQELNAAAVVTYVPLALDPVVNTNNFTKVGTQQYDGTEFSHACQTTYGDFRGNTDYSERYIEFTVRGIDPENVRIKFCKSITSHSASIEALQYDVLLNDSVVYSHNEELTRVVMNGLNAIPVPGVKMGDVLKFVVRRAAMATTNVNVVVAACLEYTSSNGGESEEKTTVAFEDPNDKGCYYASFYSNRCAYKIPEGFKPYTGVVDGDKLYLLPLKTDFIPKDEPVVLRGHLNIEHADTMFTMYPIIADAPVSEVNDLYGIHWSCLGPQYTYKLFSDKVGRQLIPILGYFPSTGMTLGNSTACLKFDEPQDVEWFTMVLAKEGLIYHKQSEPTYRDYGFAQNCWEDPATGKFYATVSCTQELNPVELFTYAKLKSNPVISASNLTVKDGNYNGCQFNWAGEGSATCEMVVSKPDPSDHSIEFKVYGTDVANARIKWFKDCGYSQYGKYTVTVSVNGNEVYTINQNNDEFLEGLFEVPLPGLKTYDIVKFNIYGPNAISWAGTVTFAACLEYTSSNGGENNIKTVIAKEDNHNKGNYYATFYSSEDAFELPDGVTAYTGKIDGNTLFMTEIEGNVIPKGEPVVLKATVEPQAAGMLKGYYDENDGDPFELNMRATASTALPSEENDLVGTDNGFTTAPDNAYLLGVNVTYAGFLPLNPCFFPSEGRSIAANSAFLQFDNPVDVLSFEIKFTPDVPTGVDDLKRDRQGDGMKYDIMGRPVGDDYRGIVIMNGKKFVKK